MTRVEGDASIKRMNTMYYNDFFLDGPIIELTSKKVQIYLICIRNHCWIQI